MVPIFTFFHRKDNIVNALNLAGFRVIPIGISLNIAIQHALFGFVLHGTSIDHSEEGPWDMRRC